jgi:hypothetical protein
LNTQIVHFGESTMLAQDFGPVRLILPDVDAAIVWRGALLSVKGADMKDPVQAHLAVAGWSALAAASLSAGVSPSGEAQSWGDHARGKTPSELAGDPSSVALAVAGLRAIGAGYSDLVSLGDEIIGWLTVQIIAPVEAGEKTARFFARPKAG